MRAFLTILALVALAASAPAAQVDPAFTVFWKTFRVALEKDDKETIASMTRLPFLLNGKWLDRKGFLKNYKKIFWMIKKDLPEAEITKEKNGYFVFCGEQILIFEKKGKSCQFIEIGVND